MITGRDSSAVAGGLARHIPVLSRPVLEYLQPREGGIYVDGTFGAGGHARAILAAARCRVIGIDRDPSAIENGAALLAESDGRLWLETARFSDLEQVVSRVAEPPVDGVLLDLGVSSMQLDEAARGFSFRLEGPLDMRMGREGPTAADVLAAAPVGDLAAIIATLGEERHARGVARAIIAAREKSPIESTTQLAEIVSRVVRARPGDIHPATRTFQALRMFVNDELGEIAAALGAAERVLKAGGRLVVISFHSLEDRLVKTFFTGKSRTGGGSRHAPEVRGPAPSLRVLTKRPVAPDDDEIALNPRARSAKLRAAERTAAPASRSNLDLLLPHLPSLDAIKRSRRG